MGFSSRCLLPVLLAGLTNAALGAPSSLDRLVDDEPQAGEEPPVVKPEKAAVPERSAGKVTAKEPSSRKTWFGMGYEKRMDMSRSSRGRGRGRGRRR